MVVTHYRASTWGSDEALLESSNEGVVLVERRQWHWQLLATELRCGGVVVACTLDQRIADAYSANMFLVSWANCLDPSPSLWTKLESFSASQWKMVALRAAKDGFKFTKMGIVVDGRVRLGEGDEHKASLMGSYFGNVLCIPFGSQGVNKLIEKPLWWVANQVHDFLDQAVRKDHFLGMIDWVEAHRPEPALAKIYINGSQEGPAFVVSSGQRFPVSKVDFGWDRPVFGSYHFPWGGRGFWICNADAKSCQRRRLGGLHAPFQKAIGADRSRSWQCVEAPHF
ncbi:titin-like [Hibiscus syriacus]|uniref:Titin-like n=1 Tax=Hibiscus syriacus TaxID=106335 RepID=A0A6A2Z9V5_HIBSY|nr:titin-like [Hibiscus syriacus]